ncbi:MAG: FAD-binding oxidoreductase [Bdellovibrionales bacterium]|nr:FAD-binding oxidoreductase [Bdellovibrionales bacterium]
MSHASWNALARDLSGELSLDERDRNTHSEDASIFVVRPAAVAFPRGNDDIDRLLRFCREEGLSVTARGAGTSRGGQPLGQGLCLNFRRHWQSVLHWDDRSGELTVEPGVLYAEAQKFLARHGRAFPPDPSWHQCTVGGMVANNAAGIHSVKYGGTIEHFRGAEFFSGDGALHDTRVPDGLSRSLGELLQRNASLIEGDFPAVEKNSAGYSLAHALHAKNPLASVLCGSEGTLGLFTKIHLGTVRIPSHRALSIAYYPSLASALEAGLRMKEAGVAACELVDKVLLDLHAGHEESRHARRITGNRWLDEFYALSAEAVLIVECDGFSSEEVERCQRATEEASGTRAIYRVADGEAGAAWDLRRHTSPILNKVENGRVAIKPLWAVEDVCLPRHRLVEYVAEQDRIFRRHGLVCSFFGHVASANLHIDPLHLNLRGAGDGLFDRVTEESYRLVVRMGGSISGEHGDGLLRTRFLPLQYPRSFPLFAEVKKLFDPLGILNPGKIVL